MKFNRLGQTGLFVSQLCMGTWGFSGRNYFGGAIGTLSQKDATGFIGRALEARINFIDTANVYSFGDSEAMTGQALKDIGVKRSDVVLATKGRLVTEVFVSTSRSNCPMISIAALFPMNFSKSMRANLAFCSAARTSLRF